MSRLSTQDFVGNRVRMQRLRDAKLLNAWVTEFFGNTVRISTGTAVPLEVGDEFRVEVFGEKLLLTFQAELSEVGQMDMISGGVSLAIEGSNVRMIEAHTVNMLLNVTTAVKFTHSVESARYKVDSLHVGITYDGGAFNGILVDVSKDGIGVSCEKDVPKESEVDLVIPTHLGDVRCTATVRYCREDPEKFGFFRVGLLFLEMSRLEKPRWQRYLQELY